MFKFGRKGKIQRAAVEFVTTVARNHQPVADEFTSIMRAGLRRNNIAEERTLELVTNTTAIFASYAALLCLELLTAFDDDNKDFEAAWTSTIDALSSEYEKNAKLVTAIMEMIAKNVAAVRAVMPASFWKETTASLVGLNVMNVFGAQRPEIKQLLDDKTVKDELTVLFDKARSGWWDQIMKGW